MKAVVAAFNQEKALVGAFSVITNLRMELFEALIFIYSGAAWAWAWAGASGSVAPLGETHRHWRQSPRLELTIDKLSHKYLLSYP